MHRLCRDCAQAPTGGNKRPCASSHPALLLALSHSRPVCDASLRAIAEVQMPTQRHQPARSWGRWTVVKSLSFVTRETAILQCPQSHATLEVRSWQLVSFFTDLRWQKSRPTPPKVQSGLRHPQFAGSGGHSTQVTHPVARSVT